MLKTFKNNLPIILTTILAAFLRFFLIHEIPCGLFPDQATNGLDALRFSHGHFSPVFGAKEGLFIYILALTHAIFGSGIWQIFITSAFIGTLTIPAIYLAGKEIFNKKIAFLSGFFLAISSWHIALSRNGFRAITMPLIISIFIFFLAKSFKAQNSRQRQKYFVLSGISFALGFYTYNSYIIFAFSVFVISSLFIFYHRKKIKSFFKENKTALIKSISLFMLTLFPIALFVILFPEKYFARATEVSIFSSQNPFQIFTTFAKNFWQHLIGIFYQGDANWRHNSSGHPLLHPLLTPFFIITFIYALIKKHKLLILFALFFAMISPAALSNEGHSPHGLRLIGIIPFLFIIPAISIAKFLEFKGKTLQIAAKIIIALILITTAFSSYKNYFLNAPYSSHFYEDFRCDLTQAVNYLKKNPETFIISEKFEFENIRYLLPEIKFENQTPTDFLNSTSQNSAPSNIILFSSFSSFNREVIDFLSQTHSPQPHTNRFKKIDFYVFKNE